MKNLMLLTTLPLFFLLLVKETKSQSIPNGDFENWSSRYIYSKPDSWSTPTNWQTYFINGQPNVSRDTSSFKGQYALKATTVKAGSDTIFGLSVLGDFSMGQTGAGYPYNEKPDSITGMVKYDIAQGDTAQVLVLFQDNGIFIGAAAASFAGTSNTYQRFKMDVFISPFEPAPDTIMFYISSSNFTGGKAIPGSSIWIDEIFFHGVNQQIPNNGFENWTDLQMDEPDNWFTVNFIATIFSKPSVTKSSDSYSGNYAVRIENVNIFGDTVGIMTNGRLGPDALPMGGMKVDKNPAKVTGYYKYFPQHNDTALAGIWAYRYDTAKKKSIVADSNLTQLNATSTYKRFELPLSYNSTPKADTLNITFTAGNMQDESQREGSVLFVDSLHVVYRNGASVPVSLFENEQYTLYPNPARDNLYMKYSGKPGSELTVSLYSTEGKKVYRKKIEPGFFQAGKSLDVTLLKEGIYIYTIHGESGMFGQGKVRISR